MTWLAAAGYSSESATVCGGAASNLWNGENGAVQQPCVSHDAAARAVVMAPDRMLPSVARASSVVVMRSRFVRIGFLQAGGGCRRLSNQRHFGVFSAFSYPRVS